MANTIATSGSETAFVGSAKALARAMLGARSEFGSSLESLLTADLAWTLAVLLLAWRPEGPVPIQTADYGDVLRQFDLYADTMLRFRSAAVSAKTPLDLAGASGIFISAVRQIGETGLAYVLRTGRIAKIQQEILARIPVPANLVASTELPADSQESRARRFLAFEYRSRRERMEPIAPADAAPPSEVEIGQWQAMLARGDLTPPTRWLLEQKLIAANRSGYADRATARARWQEARAAADNDDIRAYFARNLRELGKA